MNWQQVCEHPSLQNLPFKIELDQYGEIIMSPVKFNHSAYQGKIVRLFGGLVQQGEVVVECAIQTRKGTKVAEVAWLSAERFAQNKGRIECGVAPEICVEVLSSETTRQEIRGKRKLYIEQGAQEVWICTEDGTIQFYSADGRLNASTIVPQFPSYIRI